MSQTETEVTQPAADSGQSGLAAIATWSAPEPARAQASPISARTGEPTRVWTIWVAAVASYLAVAVIGVATVMIYWNAAVIGSLTFDQASGEWTYEFDGGRFAQAAWLMGQFETEPGSLGRVLLAVAVTVIALLIGISAAITGYYVYDGRAWTRWSALIALGLSGLSLMLNPLAAAAIGLTALAAGAVWLPPSSRYFAAWRAVRHHEPVFSPPHDDVRYGPLPRFR
ncbi:MAG: hypothetical protein LCH76_09720 [Actinobacteria bacterium]|nr:hypothetical protein [Actinomycetota bacterium]